MPALILLCSVQFIVVLDVTIVAVALPSIGAGLDLPPATLQWVVSAYTLTFGGLLIPAGRLADVAGRRRTLVAGLVVFTGASLTCGLAGSAGSIIAARTVQGVGAALIAPSALALLSVAFPTGRARGRAVAAWTAAAATGGATGWLLGGLLADSAGWTWIFLANVPIGAAAIVAARPVLGRDEPRAGDDPRAGARRRALVALDVPGAVALTGALALVVLALSRRDLRPLVVAAALGAAFVAIERRAPRPLLPARLITAASFASAGATALLVTALSTPAMLASVLYQRDVLHRSALETGLACLPFNAAVIAGSALGPRVARATGDRRAMGTGLVALAAGAAGIAAAQLAGAGVASLAAASVAMGIGLGIASVASTAAGTAEAGATDPGLAGGVLSAAAQVGSALGAATLLSLVHIAAA